MLILPVSIPNFKHGIAKTYLLMSVYSFVQVTLEAKEKSLEAKSRGNEAFKGGDYLGAIDAYTQVFISMFSHLHWDFF